MRTRLIWLVFHKDAFDKAGTGEMSVLLLVLLRAALRFLRLSVNASRRYARRAALSRRRAAPRRRPARCSTSTAPHRTADPPVPPQPGEAEETHTGLHFTMN